MYTVCEFFLNTINRLKLIKVSYNIYMIYKVCKRFQNTKVFKKLEKVYFYFIILQNGGFFVESGSFDGETSSNTIYLEEKKNWRGLLIEMDPWLYLQTKGKNRKAAISNACLSPTTHPMKVISCCLIVYSNYKYAELF